MSFTAVLVTVGGKADLTPEEISDPAHFGAAVHHFTSDVMGDCVDWMLRTATEMDDMMDVLGPDRRTFPAILGIEENADPNMLPALEMTASTLKGQTLLMMAYIANEGAPMAPTEFSHFAAGMIRLGMV